MILSAVFSKPSKTCQEIFGKPYIKIRIWKNPSPSAKTQNKFQAEFFTEKQAFQKSFTAEQAQEFIEKHAGTAFKNCIVKTDTEEITTMANKKGEIKVFRKATKNFSTEQKFSNNFNRIKNYILQEGNPVPFLIELGVMTKDGKVVAQKYDKFRQINRFLEFINDIIESIEKLNGASYTQENPPGQTHVKIFCFKSLNYYLKNAKNGKIPLGGVMLLRESLEEIDDFRVKRCRKFELADIFLLVLFGLLSGIKDIEHIAEWAEEAEESIKGLVKFEFGPPSADTILRVFRNVNADKIEKVFIKWAHGIYEKVKIEPDRTIVAIDGKTMCGSNKVTGAKGIHIVSAWADELSLILGQVKTDEKSNEITAIPELLELIDIRGMIITIDAMGCQKKICEKIKEKKADYVLSLKGNQSTTHEAVKDFFSMDEKELTKYGVIKSEKECNPDHGRIENRQYYLCTNLSWLENKDEWPGLKAVAMAREERTVNGKTSTDVRFFLTSLDNIELVKKSIRLHWGIENRLHWCLDMTFNEDYKRHRKDHSPENMTVMRRLALNILRQAEKPENKKQDSLSKRTIWFRENRQFRQTVLRLL